MKVVKNEVELHQNSVEYVLDTLSMYKEVDQFDEYINDPIIHLYPVADTYSQDGILEGFSDALFFKMDVYDTKMLTTRKGVKLHDGILPSPEVSFSQIKIFKDMSTMIVLRGKYIIPTSTTAVSIFSANFT